MHAASPTTDRPAFCRWLLQQRSRTDTVGQLAQCAAGDRSFPRDGDWHAASRRLNELQADGDMHEALDEAVLDWACY